jgi:TolB-like protein/class 3 adenylate cyclase
MAVSNASDLAGNPPDRRKLIAVMYADMVGYSRLIGRDDAGTLQRLRKLRREVIDPAIDEHGGRIVQTGGDSLLVVFDSIDGAVRCALKVQQQVPIYDGDQPPERAIRFRIGINIGDAIADGTDLHGDAVNVVARIQAECPPGGICVTRAVRDHVHGRLDLEFEGLGTLNLKNIVRPVEAFVVRLRADGTRPSLPAGIISPAPKVAPRLSIVVLPFANLGRDPDKEYFADGITEDVTTDLSRIAHMTVISRNTAFTYKGKALATRQIGRELGVRYVLEGSIRHSDSRVRVNAQLIDAETDSHLWAERFDKSAEDLFSLQDEITNLIAKALNVELAAAEAARPVEHLDALDCILRGRAASNKSRSLAALDETIGWYERALAFDPCSTEAQTHLAAALVYRIQDFVPESSEADIERAEKLARQALMSSPRSARAHYSMAEVLRTQRRYTEAIPEYEAALALDHNFVSALAAMGRCKTYIGPVDDAILAQQRAIRLSPRDPGLFHWYFRIGEGHLLQSRVDQAIHWLERARSGGPAVWYVHAWLAAACAHNGDLPRARAELAAAMALQGSGFERGIGHIAERFSAPEIRARFEATILAGIRRAGLPDK